MELINMFDKWINERVAKSIEEQAKLHERDANRIATLERKVLQLESEAINRLDYIELRLLQVDTDLAGIDEHNGDLDSRIDEVEYLTSHLRVRVAEVEEIDSDAQAKVRRYVREYFDSAHIKVTIDKEVI
jgi:predicted transcriptional regulator